MAAVAGIGKWKLRRDRVLEPEQMGAIQTTFAAWRARGGQVAVQAHLFLLLSVVPIRLSEALALGPEHLFLARAQPFIRVRRLKKRSDEVVDDLGVSPETAALLRECRPVDGRLFPFSKFVAIRAWHRVCTEAGVQLPAYCAVHILRHTAATAILRRTKNTRLLQSLLGHECLDMVSVYTHVAFNEQAAAMTDLWGKGGA